MTDAVSDSFRLGDVFSKATSIYGRRFVLFLVLTAIAHIPQYLARFAIPQSSDATNIAIRAFIFIVLSLICYLIASGAVIYGVVQELRGRTFSLASSIEVALRRFLPMIGASICVSFLFILAFFLLVFPAIMVGCAYYVTIPVCIVEQSGVFDSMSRSAYLTRGYRWPIFGMMLLVAIGSGVASWITAIVAAPTGPTGVLVASQAISAVVSAFGAVLSGVLYYQLRVAKDGVDIDKIASVFD